MCQIRANFDVQQDVQLWNLFLAMNSYSILQVCMKFAYIVTGLVFLVSYWISDNVSQHYQFPIYVQQAWEDPYQRSLTGLWQHNSTQQKHGSVNATCWVSMIYTEYYGRVSSHYTAALSDFIPPLPHTLILSYGSV